MLERILVRAIDSANGLRAAEPHELGVLAIYADKAGKDLFAFRGDGLFLLAEQRLVAYPRIEELVIDPHVKTDVNARKLALILSDGETVELRVDGEQHGMLDLFSIRDYLRRRAVLERSAERVTA